MSRRRLLTILLVSSCLTPSIARAADSTVSAMSAASALAGPELFYCVQGGADRKCTATQISTFAAGGVTSFNSRTGAVSLTLGDVTTALGFTPLNPTNNLTDVQSVSSSRTNLGLGTAAVQNTGTSGANVPLLNGANTFSGNTVISSASFGLSGNISAAAWTTSGVREKNVAATLTDTTSSGTVAAAYSSVWPADTIAASAATTFTNYFGMYFTDPIAGTNVTLTNKFALGADSLAVLNTLQVGKPSTSTGALKLANSASANLTTIQAGNAAAARTYTWPTNFGAAGTVLTDAAGDGTLSWASGGGGLTNFSSDGTTLSGSAQTVTTSKPILSLTQTWNAGGVTFTGILVNVTNTASAAGSLLADLQLGGVSQWNVTKAGLVTQLGALNISAAGTVSLPAVTMGGDTATGLYRPAANQVALSINGTKRFDYGANSNEANSFSFYVPNGGGLWLYNAVPRNIVGFQTSSTQGQVYVNNLGVYAFTSGNDIDTSSADVILTRGAAATLQQGAGNAASPIAQTLQAQGSRAGTDTNVGGANYTISSGNGTGTGTISSLFLQSPVAVGSGTGAQTQTTGLEINKGTAVLTAYTVSTLPASPKTGAMAYVTDAVACTFLATLTGSGSVFCPVVYNGSAWVGA